MNLNKFILFRVRRTGLSLSMITIATDNDIDELVNLVNSAYRGDESRNGWTTEADLIEGSLRTDQKDLRELIISPDSIILKYISNNTITGCVHLQKIGNKLYLGLLSVSPLEQGAGIGKQLLIEAQNFAKEKHCHTIYMTVISARKELINWYEKHGYVQTGEKKPFPPDNKFGRPKRPLEFIVLEKPV